MTHLRKRMLEELQRRNYSPATTRAYLQAVQQSPSTWKISRRVEPDDLRSYRAYLLAERKLAVASVVARVAALRFFSFERSSDASSERSCPTRSPIAGCRRC